MVCVALVVGTVGDVGEGVTADVIIVGIVIGGQSPSERVGSCTVTTVTVGGCDVGPGSEDASINDGAAGVGGEALLFL